MYARLSKRVNTAREDGFTLIELLIVIVILGILAGIVVFAVGTAKDDAESSACKSEYKTVVTAQEAHKAKTGGYAASEAALITAGFLRTESASYDTSSTGAVTHVAGNANGCIAGGASA